MRFSNCAEWERPFSDSCLDSNRVCHAKELRRSPHLQQSCDPHQGHYVCSWVTPNHDKNTTELNWGLGLFICSVSNIRSYSFLIMEWKEWQMNEVVMKNPSINICQRGWPMCVTAEEDGSTSFKETLGARMISNGESFLKSNLFGNFSARFQANWNKKEKNKNLSASCLMHNCTQMFLCDTQKKKTFFIKTTTGSSGKIWRTKAIKMIRRATGADHLWI